MIVCKNSGHDVLDDFADVSKIVEAGATHKNEIEEYVKNQMQEYLEYDQMLLKGYIDPFTGEPVNRA